MSGQIKTPGGRTPPEGWTPHVLGCPCGFTHDEEDPTRKFYVSVVEAA